MATDYPLNVLLSGIDDAEYQHAPGIRSSALKHGVKSGAHFAAYLQQSRADTPALRLGRLAHLAILEPARFDATLRVRPDVDARTAKGRAQLAEWRLEQPAGIVDVSTDEASTLLGMREAAQTHPRLAHLLATGHAEQSLFWDDAAHGLRCKARFDWLAATGVICDLKTTTDASPHAFAKDMMKWGWALSASHYLEGARATGVANPDTFVLIAIEKTPPYGIGLYTLDDEVLDYGHQWRHHAMCNIRRVLHEDVVEGYPDHFQKLKLPKWASHPVEFDGT